MPDSQMLQQKTDELETAISEVQQELSRADASRRSEAHQKLADLAKKARAWLEETRARGADPQDGDGAATDARKAEEFLHEIRMHRSEL